MSLVLLLACASGLGGGDFQIPPFWVHGQAVAADLNGDGLSDVAVVATYINGSSHTDEVEVFLRRAGGGFDAPTTYSVGPGPWGLCAGDLDGDGKLDLIVSVPASTPPQQDTPGDSGGLSVLLQDPAAPGRFRPARWIPTGGGAVAATMADLNGDGLTDVAVADGVHVNSRVLLLTQAAGQPGVLLPPYPVPVGTGYGLRDLVAADLNGDGREDLVLAGYNCLMVLYQKAGGGFSPPAQLGAGLRIVGVAAADLDGDGRVDIVAAHTRDALSAERGGSSVLVLLQTQPGVFTATHIPLAGNASDLAIADLNGDGLLDVAALSQESGSKVSVLLQSPSQRGAFVTAAVLNGTQNAAFLAVGDVDGDGRTDLILNEGPSVMLQTAPGILSPPRALR